MSPVDTPKQKFLQVQYMIFLFQSISFNLYKIQILQCQPVKYREKTILSTPGLRDWQDNKLQEGVLDKELCQMREFLILYH